MNWLNEKPWRKGVISIFDKELSGVYDERKVARNLQSYEKIDKIASIANETEKIFKEAIAFLTSLNQVNVQRGKLNRILKSRCGSAFIAPFLPDNFMASLDEAYVRVSAYLEKKDESGILETYNETIKKLKEIQDFFDIGTVFSRLLGEDIVGKLIKFTNEDFSKNPAVQPADISVEYSDSKKYPLHIIGNSIKISFNLKNVGSGFAEKTEIQIVTNDCLEVDFDSIPIGSIGPNETYPLEITAHIKDGVPCTDMSLDISWTNFDNSQKNFEFELQIEGQNSNVDWSKLQFEDPYSLEAVTSEEDLIGRHEMFQRLLAILTSSNMGSAYIKGQKRVGKTSLAKAIQSRLEKEGFIVTYFESGDYLGGEDPKTTVKSLGLKLTKELARCYSALSIITVPEFTDALSPLTDYLDDAATLLHDKRILFILDEFDELPSELYLHGKLGDAFFQTLRSISNRKNIGFLVIGSEKMDRVIDFQGAKINKWHKTQVDYFSKESDWSDYKELVQRPTQQSLEFTENSVHLLHEYTSGNPYFTKLICQRIYNNALKNRDSHITETEVKNSTEVTAREEDKNRFQHFWDDGIVENSQRTEKSVIRRKILIALCDSLRTNGLATVKNIEEQSIVKDIPTVEIQLNEFVSRGILIKTSSGNNDSYSFKVPLFAKWLERRGIEEIITTFSEQTANVRERDAEEKKKIKFAEIEELVNQWKVYKSTPFSFERIQNWLAQFKEVDEQRQIFEILKNLKYYSEAFIRAKMHEVDRALKRGGDLIHKVEGRKSRSDILVSYLDGPGKSGSYLADKFVEETKISTNSIIEQSNLENVLSKREGIKALLFLDDFVGTGDSATAYLNLMDEKISSYINEKKIKVLFASIVCHKKGWEKLQNLKEYLNFPIDIISLETLDRKHQCFSPESEIFPDKNLREQAKNTALYYGKFADKKNPLGYGKLELAVVFERGCPNNTLPILWAENSNWKALFRRH